MKKFFLAICLIVLIPVLFPIALGTEMESDNGEKSNIVIVLIFVNFIYAVALWFLFYKVFVC